MLSERPGLYGGLYQYYNVNRIYFALYNLLVALFSAGMIVLLIWALVNNNKVLFKKACLIFLGLDLLIIIAEVYLALHFQGKG